jgi:streptogramin lyase
MDRPSSRLVLFTTALAAAVAGAAAGARAAVLHGRVADQGGAPLAGAMVSVSSAEPVHRITVFSHEDGSYRTPEIPFAAPYQVRVRRIGWKDLDLAGEPVASGPRDFALVRETDPAAVAAQLPANHWLARVLERIDVESEREEFLRNCGFCHQQGSFHVRKERDEESWAKVIQLMGRRGGMLSSSLRAKLPRIFREAWDPATAVPALTAGLGTAGFAPAPEPAVLDSVIEEWDLGGHGSNQHDVMVHPDGSVYGVDMPFDQLHRLDPATGERRSWKIPDDGLPPGGAFARRSRTQETSSLARVGPHSLQADAQGNVWITLATGNRLARFDPRTESFEIVPLRYGIYPHTLRLDPRGRIWYTISASNHVGMYDPATREHREMRLPTRTFQQELILRSMPFLIWAMRYVDVQGQAAQGEPIVLPIPYGIDVAPDGTVWFSQLNEHRIGRVDPETFEIEVIDTPFPAPRRLRFDSKGTLWIPSFSGSRLAAFDPRTREFREWELPTLPRGTETPYALHVDRRTDVVWICGTASDTLIRFEPAGERWTVYPLPTRVTYTREVDFDREGRIWTSNSNGPAWQIEDGVPRVLRLDPRGLAAGEVASVR